MTSVLIAAHNEEAVIGSCLEALSRQRAVEPLQIIVAANGCTDRTADVARRHGAEVLVTDQPGKANALNLADDLADGYPRIYLDADIALPVNAVELLIGALHDNPTACAAVPSRELDVAGRPFIVRSYIAISSRHPAFQDGLFGRGVIALSERGRSRFATFPTLIADDLFLDSLFTRQEKIHLDSVTVTVDTPPRVRDLMRRLVRVRRGNAQLRAAARNGELNLEVRNTERSAWLTQVVRKDPRLLPSGVIYAGVTILASLLARRSASSTAWGSDRNAQSATEPTKDHQ